MKIQRANFLQTLAFPAYFSVLTKGRGNSSALASLCHIVLNVSSGVCLQIPPPDVSTEVLAVLAQKWLFFF